MNSTFGVLTKNLKNVEHWCTEIQENAKLPYRRKYPKSAVPLATHSPQWTPAVFRSEPPERRDRKKRTEETFEKTPVSFTGDVLLQAYSMLVLIIYVQYYAILVHIAKRETQTVQQTFNVKLWVVHQTHHHQTTINHHIPIKNRTTWHRKPRPAAVSFCFCWAASDFG